MSSCDGDGKEEVEAETEVKSDGDPDPEAAKVVVVNGVEEIDRAGGRNGERVGSNGGGGDDEGVVVVNEGKEGLPCTRRERGDWEEEGSTASEAGFGSILC